MTMLGTIKPRSANSVRIASTRRVNHGLLRWWLVAIASGLVLSGCGGGSMSDLQSYVQQVLARKGGKIEPIPPLEPYVVYSYQSSGGVDPFKSFFEEEPEEDGAIRPGEGGVSPNMDRNREELENYALDSLRMMGTLEQGPDVWGIVRSPDGTIHRVQTGNYIGRNHGKIIHISEEKIELTEIVVDSRNRWQERPAALALAE